MMIAQMRLRGAGLSPWGASRLLLTGLVLALAAASASAISSFVRLCARRRRGCASTSSFSICLNGRKLEPRMTKPLFDAELKRNAGLYEADMPVQLVLLNALMSAYVC